MTLVRTFISIEMPENIIREANKIQKQLPEFRGKFTEEENLHLTLKFLGSIDENKLDEVRKNLRDVKIKRFYSEISEIGVFPPEKIRIVWLKLTNCEFLQEEVDEKLSGLFIRE